MRRSDCDDVDLLRAAGSGDDRAFAEFYRRWLPLVTGYHLRRTRSRELAFDLTAETFAAVVAGLPRFDPDRGSAAGWLFEIAEHKLLDSRRRARVESSARARLGHEPVILEDRDLDVSKSSRHRATPTGWIVCLRNSLPRNATPFVRGCSTNAPTPRLRARCSALRRSRANACIADLAACGND